MPSSKQETNPIPAIEADASVADARARDVLGMPDRVDEMWCMTGTPPRFCREGTEEVE